MHWMPQLSVFPHYQHLLGHTVSHEFFNCHFLIHFFPKQCGNTWGSYGNGKKPGWLDRGGGRGLCRIHRYFRGFVLACSFRL